LLRKEKERIEDEVAALDEMDRFGAKHGIGSLREKRLPATVYELRIWIGVSPNTTRGLIIGEDTARYLPPIGDIGQEKYGPSRELRPASEWETFWNEVQRSGLLYFPTEPSAAKIEPWNDSDVVIVETRKGINYRSIMYGFPCKSTGAQAKLLLEAINNISGQLDIDFYRCN